MATGRGGGSPEGHGGGRSGGGGGQIEKQVLFGPGLNMGDIDVESDDDREWMYISPEAEQEGARQVATASHCSTDPLSHYLPDYGLVQIPFPCSEFGEFFVLGFVCRI